MRNRRNTRRGRAKRWRTLVSISDTCADYESREIRWPGVTIIRSHARPDTWLVVWYSKPAVIRRVWTRREAFKVAEAIVRMARK
jgi:hypothetical protein